MKVLTPEIVDGRIVVRESGEARLRPVMHRAPSTGSSATDTACSWATGPATPARSPSRTLPAAWRWWATHRSGTAAGSTTPRAQTGSGRGDRSLHRRPDRAGFRVRPAGSRMVREGRGSAVPSGKLIAGSGCRSHRLAIQMVRVRSDELVTCCIDGVVMLDVEWVSKLLRNPTRCMIVLGNGYPYFIVQVFQMIDREHGRPGGVSFAPMRSVDIPSDGR